MLITEVVFILIGTSVIQAFMTSHGTTSLLVAVSTCSILYLGRGSSVMVPHLDFPIVMGPELGQSGSFLGGVPNWSLKEVLCSLWFYILFHLQVEL